MKLHLTLGSLDEGNGVGKSKQTAVRQLEDYLFNLVFILSNVFLLGGLAYISNLE